MVIHSHNIAATDLKSDIVCWNYDQKTLSLVELMVRFEISYEAAITRKKTGKGYYVSIIRSLLPAYSK